MHHDNKVAPLNIDLNGIDHFADVLKHNFGAIYGSLTLSDKDRLFRLMPQGVKDKERYLQGILKGDK